VVAKFQYLNKISKKDPCNEKMYLHLSPVYEKDNLVLICKIINDSKVFTDFVCLP